MKKCLCYSVILFFLLSSSCKKDKPTVAEPKGDYFTCYVNGVYWEAYSDAAGPQSAPAVYGELYQDTILSLSATKFFNNGYSKIFIPVYNISGIGTYSMTISHNQVKGMSNFSTNCNKHYYDSLNPGIFNLIEHNTQTHFMRGTFSMTLRNPNCEDSILHITNGKFSFHYY